MTIYSATDLILARLKADGISIIIILFLLAGLGIAVYSSQQEQSYKSKAEISEGLFSITDINDNPLPYRGNNIYRTDTLNIRIRIKDMSLLLE